MNTISMITDLKLIDELLVDLMVARKLRPDQVEGYSANCRDAIQRLRQAWESGEMPAITKTWADLFADGSKL